MVDLVRAGRDPDDLAREFEPTGQSIRSWVAQAGRNEGRRAELTPGLAAAERDELIRLRRENKQLETSNNLLFGRKEPGIRPLRRWLIAGGQRLAVGPLR